MQLFCFVSLVGVLYGDLLFFFFLVRFEIENR